MIKKLRVRFVVVNMSIVAVLLTVMMTMVFRFNRHSLEEQSLNAMRRQAVVNAQFQGPASGGDRTEEMPMACFGLSVSPEGELLSWGSPYYDLSDEEYLLRILAAATETGEDSGVLEEFALRFCRASHRRDQYIFADISGERQILANIRRSCMMVGGTSFVAFFMVSLLLANWAIRPVEKAWQQQRQFVADASHELKTPLAVVMANAELLQEQSCPAEDRSRFAGHILSVSYQMRTLVERLLEMARVDSVKAPLAPLELSQLTRDAVLSVLLLYEENGRPLEQEIQENLWIRGNENQLYQLMDVLLDNALKYSQGSGAVKVALRAQGGRCLLSVSSPGPGLTAQQRRDIFKRFYRVDQARAMDGSYGLGLSIAQGIVEHHRGKIWAESRHGINTFRVQLSACAAPDSANS